MLSPWLGPTLGPRTLRFSPTNWVSAPNGPVVGPVPDMVPCKGGATPSAAGVAPPLRVTDATSVMPGSSTMQAQHAATAAQEDRLDSCTTRDIESGAGCVTIVIGGLRAQTTLLAVPLATSEAEEVPARPRHAGTSSGAPAGTCAGTQETTFDPVSGGCVHGCQRTAWVKPGVAGTGGATPCFADRLDPARCAATAPTPGGRSPRAGVGSRLAACSPSNTPRSRIGAITRSILGLPSDPSRLVALLRPLCGCGLDRSSGQPGLAHA